MAIYPPPLSPGSLVGVAAPAGFLQEPERFHHGCSIIREMGFEIFEPDKRWPGYGYLADSDERRLDELHRLWANPDLDAIFTLRGGYGSLRILKGFDLSLPKKIPKLLIGFSDITILLNHLYSRTGLVTMHGPGLATLPSSDRRSLDRLYHCLRGDWHRSLEEDIEIVRASDPVNGPLLGGNLSSLVTMIGTGAFPDLRGAILLLEDINEPFYRIDRLLTQLHLSGALDDINGLILGQFCGDDCKPVERLRVNEFVWQRIIELTRRHIPIWGNFPAGHCRTNLTVPLGAVATMDSDKSCLHFSRCEYDD